MLAYLYGVVAAGAVNKKLAVDVYGNMMYLHPALAFACSAAPGVRAITFAAGSILAGKKDEVACLKLGNVSKQHIHVVTFLRHACGR